LSGSNLDRIESNASSSSKLNSSDRTRFSSWVSDRSSLDWNPRKLNADGRTGIMVD
jgi:hypothetical protein